MKRNLLIIFLAFICTSTHYNAFSQNDSIIIHQIDSLNNEIKLQQPSVERIKTRLSLVDAYRQFSNEKATKEGIFAVQEAEAIGNDSTLLLTRKKLGTCFLNSGDYDGAFKCYNEALELAVKIKDTFEIGSLKNNIGLIYRNMGLYEEASKYLSEACEAYESINDIGFAAAYKNYASIYYMQEEYEKYIDECKKIQEFHLKNNDSIEWANVTYNIAMAYLQWDQIALVLKTLHEVLPIYEHYNNDKGIALTLYMMGYIHVRELGEYEEGLKYLYRAERYNRLLGTNIELARCYAVMAKAFLETDSINKSFIYYDKGLGLHLAANNLEGILNSYYELGMAHDRVKNHEKAHQYYQLCIDKSEAHNDSRYSMNIHEAKMRNAFILNKSESFFESYNIYIKHVNSINTELGNLKLELSQITDESQELYKTYKKESDKASELSKKVVLYRSFAVFFGLLTLTLLILFIIFHKKKENSKSKKQS